MLEIPESGTMGIQADKTLRNNWKHGEYKTILLKNTVQYPCSVCGGAIFKEACMGGAVYFCPVCQKI